MNSNVLSVSELAGTSGAVQPKVDIYEVRVLRSNTEIEDIREVWTSWQNHPNADMDFYLMLIQLQKQVVRPHVILVSRGGRPQAMAIGRIEKDTVNIKFGYKSIANFPVLTLQVIQGGLLGDYTPEAARAILGSLKQSLRNGEAEIVKLSYTPVESEIIERLPDEVSFLCREHFVGKRIHRKMTLGCTAQEMYARLSRDHRQQLRKKARAFERDFPGGLTVHCFREPGELEQMAADVEEVAKTTYQRGLGAGFRDSEENRRIMRFEANQGWLRVYVLYIKGKPCAYWYGTIYHGILYGIVMGFDTQYRKYSPGTYLFTKTLEDSCNQGIKAIHFGLVDAQYKQQFANQHGYETIISMCAARPRLIALILMSSLSHGLRAAALAIVERFNTLQYIRRRWRGKCAPKKAENQK